MLRYALLVVAIVLSLTTTASVRAAVETPGIKRVSFSSATVTGGASATLMISLSAKAPEKGAPFL